MKFILVVSLVLIISSCGEAPGGDAGSFLGSCTEEQIPDSMCVDYYPAYSLSQAQTFCTTSADTFSTNTCETDNGTSDKISGKCKITDNVVASGGISYVSYYTGFYSITTAQLHCTAYLSITGFSSEWVSD